MKTQIIKSEKIISGARLDCWYYLSPANSAISSIEHAKKAGYSSINIGGPTGFAKVWKPTRSKLSYAVEGERKIPYLRPYDVFNYFPEPADWLSVPRTEDLEDYTLHEGTILQTCSGRNLGPAVIVDKYLEKFVIGADMIRIFINDERLRFYLLAFLNSQSGKKILRRNKTGSVVDHLSEEDMRDHEILLLDDDAIDKIVDLMKRSITIRENARLKLFELIKSIEGSLPKIERCSPPKDGWIVKSDFMTGRIDAAFYDPLVDNVRQELINIGGIAVKDVARVLKPGGRYKTRYLSKEYGVPILSGSQLVQTYTINLRYISPAIFQDITKYQLKAGWIAYPADGRAEEELGTPVIITQDRDNWLASGHVGRIIPKEGINPGWLFLALKAKHAQIQLKARASGSVVDSTFEKDMEEVILPPQSSHIDWDSALYVWNNLGEAQTLEEMASAIIDNTFIKFGTT